MISVLGAHLLQRAKVRARVPLPVPAIVWVAAQFAGPAFRRGSGGLGLEEGIVESCHVDDGGGRHEAWSVGSEQVNRRLEECLVG